MRFPRAAIAGATGVLAAVTTLGLAVQPGSAAHLAVDGGVAQSFQLPGPVLPDDPADACPEYGSAALELGIDLDVLDVGLYLQVCEGVNLGIDLGGVLGGGGLGSLGLRAASDTDIEGTPTAPTPLEPSTKRTPREQEPDPVEDPAQPGSGVNAPAPDPDPPGQTETEGGPSVGAEAGEAQDPAPTQPSSQDTAGVESESTGNPDGDDAAPTDAGDAAAPDATSDQQAEMKAP